MGYPHGTVPTPPGVTVQPTPIYETLAMCLLAYFLWKLRDRVRPGVIFGLYLVFGGLERLLVEFIRRNKEVLAGLTAPQLESIALMAIGAVLLVAIGRRDGLASPGGGGGVPISGRPTRARASTA
jgi:phosphatidylglycerol:prolipoprotein diacylglycerol transferase